MKPPEVTRLELKGFSLADEAKFSEVTSDGHGFRYHFHRGIRDPQETIVFNVGAEGCVIDVETGAGPEHREPTLDEIKRFLDVMSVGFPHSPLTGLFTQFVKAQGAYLSEAAASAEIRAQVLRSLNPRKE